MAAASRYLSIDPPLDPATSPPSSARGGGGGGRAWRATAMGDASASGAATRSAWTVPAKRTDDALDAAVAYLKKRDGVDKVLKIIRYAAKLALATRYREADPLYSPAAAKLKRLEASIGDARKAYRIGKFLQGVQALRRVGWGSTAPLAVLAAAGDAAYYAIEQGTWLVRAGVIDARYARRLARASAAAELVSYAGSASLAALAAAAAGDRERVLAFRLRSATASRDERAARSLEAQLAAAAAARRSAEAALLQDACDALLAAADLGDGKGPIASSRGLLAAAGLASALLGARKAWLK